MIATVHDRVQKIFRDVFNDETLTVRNDMTAKDVEGWDSLNQINLIIMIENEFGLQFDPDEIATLANVGELFVLLSKYGVVDE